MARGRAARKMVTMMRRERMKLWKKIILTFSTGDYDAEFDDKLLIENNNIDSLEAVKIAEYLEDDPPIKYLSLESNRLNDDDASLISQALKRNTNLVSLYLNSNNFTTQLWI